MHPVRAAIIAGGKGTRIRSVTGDLIPKALVPVAGVPIIFRQLDLLARHGFREIGVIAGHLAAELERAMRPEAQRLGLRLEFFIEKEPLGTAGGLMQAAPFFAGADLCVVCGDIAMEMDLCRLYAFHRAHGGMATIVVHPNDHPHESDLVAVDAQARVLEVMPRRERAKGSYRNLVPSSVYCLCPELLTRFAPGEKQDFIKDVFPALLKTPRGVYAYNTPEYLRDVGTPERLQMVERDIASGLLQRMVFGHRRPAVFFDRDGVLVEDEGSLGVTDPEKMVLMPRAAEAVKLANENGLLAILITNQPGVAKGFLTPGDLDAMHAKLDTLLGYEGAKLDAIYACPHHPERGHPGEVAALKIDCTCRKPKPGLLLQAAQDLPILLEDSCMIGDSVRDIIAAHAAGVTAYGVRTGKACCDCTGTELPDLMFADAYEALSFLINRS